MHITGISYRLLFELLYFLPSILEHNWLVVPVIFILPVENCGKFNVTGISYRLLIELLSFLPSIVELYCKVVLVIWFLPVENCGNLVLQAIFTGNFMVKSRYINTSIFFLSAIFITSNFISYFGLTNGHRFSEIIAFFRLECLDLNNIVKSKL